MTQLDQELIVHSYMNTVITHQVHVPACELTHMHMYTHPDAIRMSAPNNIAYSGLEGSGNNVLFTIDTHPSADLLAAGEISGKVTL